VARLQLRIDRMQQASVRAGFLPETASDRPEDEVPPAVKHTGPGDSAAAAQAAEMSQAVSVAQGIVSVAQGTETAQQPLVDDVERCALASELAAHELETPSREMCFDELLSGATDAATASSRPLEEGHRAAHEQTAFGSAWRGFLERWVPSGWPELDALLPGGGFRRGAIVEWFASDASPGDATPPGQELAARTRATRSPQAAASVLGHGGALLSLRAAWALCRDAGTLVVLDQTGWFYPPAAAAWGIDLQRLVWLRVDTPRDAFWALDQSLRCTAVRAVWSCLGGWDSLLDGRWFRRFQLAAEQSGTAGMLVRSPRFRNRPSWAELRLDVSPDLTDHGQASADRAPPARMPPASRTLRVELLQSRGASRGASRGLGIDRHGRRGGGAAVAYVESERTTTELPPYGSS
jgi:hypothetical protein